LHRASSHLSVRAVKHNPQHGSDMSGEGLWIHDEGSNVVRKDYYWNDICLLLLQPFVGESKRNVNGSPTPPQTLRDVTKLTRTILQPVYMVVQETDRQTDCKINDAVMIHRFLTGKAMAIVIRSVQSWVRSVNRSRWDLWFWGSCMVCSFVWDHQSVTH
jgi:hypothetical protein